MKMHLIIESLEMRRLLSANILADFGGIYPTQSVTVNGISYFAANDGTHGTELWKSDGTIAGTVMVKDLTAGSASTQFDGMYAVGNRLLFFTPDPSHKNTFALWSSDGTAAGTIRLCHAGVDVRYPAAVLGDELVFTVSSGLASTDQATLWTSDGTVGGTQQVFQFPTDPNRYPVFHLYTVGTHVVMAEEGALWTTDGTAQGTVDLTNIPSTLGSGGPQQLDDVRYAVVYDNEMYFANEEAEVWKTDGTTAGTQLVRPAIGDIDITAMKEVGGKIYFSNSASDQYHDEADLYITDGTQQGTYILASFKSMNPIADAGEIGDDMIFGVTNAGTSEVWITDGTISGTKPLHVEQTSLSLSPNLFRSVDGIVFFEGFDDAHGGELWRTDGTSAGTMLLQDLTPGPDTSEFLYDMAVADGRLIVHTGQHPLVFDPATMSPGVGPTEQALHMDGSVLRIFGTRDDDSIHLYDVTDDPTRFIVELNGVKRSFAFSDVSRIYIYSYSGNDTIEVKDQLEAFTARCAIWSGDGDDTIETGDGRDTLYGEGGDDYIFGGNNNDMLSGGDGNDSLLAGNGNDTASGGDGADDIQGNKGNDIISGGADNSKDTLDGGAGGNVLFGQAVYDTFFTNKPDAGVAVDDVLES